MISPDLKKLYASGGDAAYIEVLRFKHPGFSKTWYLANQIRPDGSLTPWTFKDENGTSFTCVYVPFEISLPIHDGQGRQDMSIVLGNIGRELIKELENAHKTPTSPIECTLFIYLDAPDTDPQADPIVLNIDSPVVSDSAVTIEASRYDVLNRPFPAKTKVCVYNTDLFPGLDR